MTTKPTIDTSASDRLAEVAVAAGVLEATAELLAQLAEFINLCRRRHRSIYAAAVIMPTCLLSEWRSLFLAWV